jgi:hypothetical protein
LIGNASGQDAEGAGIAPSIFDKETRRKRLAVVGAAMELRARLGLGERRDESAVAAGLGCDAR